jgi:hypothetical protein
MESETVIRLRSEAVSLAHEACEIEGDLSVTTVLTRARAYAHFLNTGEDVSLPERPEWWSGRAEH